MNALKLLKKDHAQVKGLLDRIDRTSETDHKTRIELFEEVRRELQIHLRTEEEIFYPAIKALNGDGRRLIAEAMLEHKDIDTLMTQTSRLEPQDANFSDKLEALIENVESHIEEEEGEIFQFAEENCSPQQLDELGNQLEDRRRALNQLLAA